jgi:UDP-N-acetylglucosamine--N-acetylmuramyl-(pentapeptide) pyrophosphoryl-undecaprenol N-acetylglucosamine transferase
VFIGGDRMEKTTVPAAGYDFFEIDIRGFKRSFDAANFGVPGQVRRAASGLRKLFVERGTRVALGFGGYVTGPTALAARRSGIPLILQEQNARPGVANRFAHRMAKRTFVAFEEATRRLSGSELVGNPLRSAFRDFDRSALRKEALERYDLDESAPVIGVLGGSLGALILNQAIVDVVAAAPRPVGVIQIAGRRDYEESLAIAAKAQDGATSSLRWAVVPFETSMQHFYAVSDLVISRAGALAMSELSVTGTPSVVVPLPAGRGYQAENARDLADVGGTVIIDQSFIAALPATVTELIGDRARLAMMGRRAETVGRPGAADTIAAAAMEYAGA